MEYYFQMTVYSSANLYAFNLKRNKRFIVVGDTDQSYKDQAKDSKQMNELRNH